MWREDEGPVVGARLDREIGGEEADDGCGPEIGHRMPDPHAIGGIRFFLRCFRVVL